MVIDDFELEFDELEEDEAVDVEAKDKVDDFVEVDEFFEDWPEKNPLLLLPTDC